MFRAEAIESPDTNVRHKRPENRRSARIQIDPALRGVTESRQGKVTKVMQG